MNKKRRDVLLASLILFSVLFIILLHTSVVSATVGADCEGNDDCNYPTEVCFRQNPGDIFGTCQLNSNKNMVLSPSASAANAPTGNGNPNQYEDCSNLPKAMTPFGTAGNYLKCKYKEWLFFDITKVTSYAILAQTMKVFVLLLVLVLVYSAFTLAKFPKYFLLRLGLAFAIAYVSTITLSASELVTLLLSYNALSITFAVFMPIFVLSLFTFVVALDGRNKVGILFQRVMWLVYSLYLFFKVAVLLLAFFSLAPQIASYDANGNPNSYVMNADGSYVMALPAWVNDVSGNMEVSQIKSYDVPTLIILLCVSIAVFLLGVVYNNSIMKRLMKMKTDADIEYERNLSRRSHAAREIDSARLGASEPSRTST